MNRKLLLATVAIVALPGTAMASASLYIGGNVGAVQAKASDDYSIPNEWDTDYTVPPVNTSTMGFLIGGQAGVDWGVGHSTWGLVVDYNALTGADQKRFGGWPDCGSSCDVTVKTDVKGLISIRGRAGFNVFDDTLVYGTAGIGWLEVDDNTDVGDGKGGNFHNTKWHPAFVVGGGVEQKIDDNWSIAGQVLHAQTKTFSQNARDTSYFDSDLPVYYQNSVTLGMVSANFHF